MSVGDDADEEQSRRVMLRGPGCLTVIGGGPIGLSYRVGDVTMVLGRGKGADVVVGGDGVSRKHAELVRNQTGSVKLVDLGSRNGTFVNEVKITTAVLEDGDRIRVGVMEFDFRYEKQDDRATVDLAASSSVSAPTSKKTLQSGQSVSRRMVTTMANLARVHATAGRYRDAVESYRRTLAALEAQPGEDPEQLVATLLGIGECQLQLGAPRQAIDPLRQALDLMQATRRSARELASPRFMLARALGVGNEQALALARLARDELDPSDPKERRLRTEIELWLDNAPE